MPQYLKQPPKAFKKALDASGLSLRTIGSGGRGPSIPGTDSGDDSEPPGWRPRVFHCLFLRLQALSLKVKISASTWGQLREPEPSQTARRSRGNSNEVGKRTADAGIKLAFHPHASLDPGWQA